jgi:hypothetical protein
MQTFNAKHKVHALHDVRRERRQTRRSGVLSWAIASVITAVPFPAFAESGPGENIALAMSSSIVASPTGTGDMARAVPGAIVDYSVVVTGPSASGSPATSFSFSDKVPEHLALFVGDLEQVGAGPAVFFENDSGLEFSFEGLASREDSVEFSSDGGRTFDYVPLADPDGYDQNVTHIKLRPRGTLLPMSGKAERFSLRYRMKVK